MMLKRAVAQAAVRPIQRAAPVVAHLAHLAQAPLPAIARRDREAQKREVRVSQEVAARTDLGAEIQESVANVALR